MKNKYPQFIILGFVQIMIIIIYLNIK